jgi:hypothetical protein
MIALQGFHYAAKLAGHQTNASKDQAATQAALDRERKRFATLRERCKALEQDLEECAMHYEVLYCSMRCQQHASLFLHTVALTLISNLELQQISHTACLLQSVCLHSLLQDLNTTC